MKVPELGVQTTPGLASVTVHQRHPFWSLENLGSDLSNRRPGTYPGVLLKVVIGGGRDGSVVKSTH